MFEAILHVFGTEEDIKELHSHMNELFYPDICWTAVQRWLKEHYMNISLDDARPTTDSNKLVAKALMIASALHEFISSPVYYGHDYSDYEKMERTVNQALSELVGIVPGLHHITIQITDDEGFSKNMAAEMNRIMEEILADDEPNEGIDVEDCILEEFLIEDESPSEE